MKYPEITWGRMEAIINKLGGMEGVERFLSGELVVKAVGLLRHVTAVTVGGAKKFIAKSRLKKANIGFTGDNFDQFFLNKVEENIEAGELNISRLEKNSLDVPILAELGERAEISLAQFFELIEKQANGQEGPLLTNVCANIAYVRGTDGNLWTVSALWYPGDRCWYVNALSFEGPLRWRAGNQVISRK